MTTRTWIFTQTSGMAWALARTMGHVTASRQDMLVLEDALIFWVPEAINRHAHPPEYQRDWKRYRWGQLPLMPDMKTMRTPAGKHLLECLKTTLFTNGGAPEKIILAPAPDAAGFWLMKQIVDLLGLLKIGPECEIWVANLDHFHVKVLHPAHLKPWRSERLVEAEQCRVHGDWLLGINLTRMLTLAYPEQAGIGCGRVSTPLLQLIEDGPYTEPNIGDGKDFASIQGWFVSRDWPAGAVVLALQWLYEHGMVSYPFGRSAIVPHESSRQTPDFYRRLPSSYPSALHAQIVQFLLGTLQDKSRGPGRLEQRRLGGLYRRMGQPIGADAGVGSVPAIGSPKSRHKALERLMEQKLVDSNTVTLTTLGRQHLEATPPVLRDPRLISAWEHSLHRVFLGEIAPMAFYREVQQFLLASMEYVRSRGAFLTGGTQ